MSALLVVLLLAILMLGGFVLYQDTRFKLVDQQIALMLPVQVAVSAPLSLRLQNPEADDGRLRRFLRVLRLLMRYKPNSPNQLWFALVALVASAGSVVVSSLLLPLWLALIVGFAVWALVMRGLFDRQQSQYTNRLVRQMPDTLQIITSAARAGLPVAEAFRAVTREMPQPTQEQFTLVLNDMVVGKTIDDALLGIFHRTKVSEYAMFSITMAVQGKAGGRLAETLQTLADTVRQRISLAGRAKALAGEATLSARVLSCLPFIAGIITYLERPDTMNMLFYDPRGRLLFAIGVISLSLGVWTMRRMIRKGTTV